jgi:DNA-binding transcriptional LysR family regulator
MGAVNIGVGPSVMDIITEVIHKAIESHPTLKITLTEGPEETLYSGLRSGELDLVICTVTKRSADPDLNHEILFSNPTVPIVRKGHPLSNQRKTGWASLKRFPWVVADMHLEPAGKDIFDALSSNKPTSIITTNSSTFMKTLVSKSDFIAFMPHTLVACGGFEEKLDIVGPKKGLYKTEIGITSRTNSFLSPAGNLIIEEFKKSCADMSL